MVIIDRTYENRAKEALQRWGITLDESDGRVRQLEQMLFTAFSEGLERARAEMRDALGIRKTNEQAL